MRYTQLRRLTQTVQSVIAAQTLSFDLTLMWLTFLRRLTTISCSDAVTLQGRCPAPRVSTNGRGFLHCLSTDKHLASTIARVPVVGRQHRASNRRNHGILESRISASVTVAKRACTSGSIFCCVLSQIAGNRSRAFASRRCLWEYRGVYAGKGSDWATQRSLGTSTHIPIILSCSKSHSCPCLSIPAKSKVHNILLYIRKIVHPVWTIEPLVIKISAKIITFVMISAYYRKPTSRLPLAYNNNHTYTHKLRHEWFVRYSQKVEEHREMVVTTIVIASWRRIHQRDCNRRRAGGTQLWWWPILHGPKSADVLSRYMNTGACYMNTGASVTGIQRHIIFISIYLYS